ncbi:MAG TPA: adenylate/guanylate cyclase domain-containing protein [Rhizobiaceae bacterium]|nr:adenylate/guanylate cyclase domain-containing protein [Rhizobiaceae bacterium]
MTSVPRPAGRFFTLFTMPGATRRAEEENARKNPHLLRALEEEKTEGQRIATWARTIALAIVAVLLVFINPRPEVIYYLFLLLLFVLIGIAQLRAARVGQSRIELGLIFADIALLAITLAAPNPFAPDNWPTALQFKFEGFVYFFIFLAGATLAYSWRTVQTIGMWTAVIWMTAVGLVAWFGKQFPELSPKLLEAVGGDQRIFDLINPNSVILPSRIQEVVVFLIVAVILGLKSQRTNALLMRQAHLAAERANLSRYFPPSMVEELAQRNEPMGGVRSQKVAVLFADVVGFTKYAESHSPEEVIGLLRSLHVTLEEAVFAHGGTLDKYMGDGVMASFGTPSPTPADAANAVAAAFAMQDGVQKLNEGRIATGKEPVRLSVGVHYGPVILGDIGSERRMEFATLGDTVNVASRLEAATRELSCAIAISQSVIDAIAEPEARTRFCQAMRSQPRLALKGRAEEVDVWLA